MSVERDFELLGEVLGDNAEPLYVDGQILEVGGDEREEGKCHADCSFAKMEGTPRQPVLFLCKKHKRVHVCGQFCTRQIISHEDSSCEWTGETMRGSLVAEEVNRHQIQVPTSPCEFMCTGILPCSFLFP